MDDSRATELANVLLQEGTLLVNDPEHRQIYTELMENAPLYQDVEQRLAAVGYELVQQVGHMGVRTRTTGKAHLGVRIASKLEDGGSRRNRMLLHAGHIRLIVYLWVYLVYREWINLRRDLDSVAPGNEQGSLLFDESSEDEPPSISYRHVVDEFGENMSKSHLKGVLGALQRWRFIRYDEKRDRIWADSALYVFVDRNRMEEFVVRLARRVGTDDPAEAVSQIATGSVISEKAK
ncbi:MAG: hypothetical protein GY854_14305 [Deltaproteobacteria bacterium]|nr:hypothetical protein [Deltaproteobacteria bacterium]